MDREVFPPREYRNSNCKIALTIEGSEKIRFVLFQRLEIRLLRSRATCGKSDRIRENSQKRIGCRKTENESMKAMGLRTLAIKWATVECLFPHKWPNSVGFPLKAKLFAKTLDDTPPPHYNQARKSPSKPLSSSSNEGGNQENFFDAFRVSV